MEHELNNIAGTKETRCAIYLRGAWGDVDRSRRSKNKNESAGPPPSGSAGSCWKTLSGRKNASPERRPAMMGHEVNRIEAAKETCCINR